MVESRALHGFESEPPGCRLHVAAALQRQGKARPSPVCAHSPTCCRDSQGLRVLHFVSPQVGKTDDWERESFDFIK